MWSVVDSRICAAAAATTAPTMARTVARGWKNRESTTGCSWFYIFLLN